MSLKTITVAVATIAAGMAFSGSAFAAPVPTDPPWSLGSLPAATEPNDVPHGALYSGHDQSSAQDQSAGAQAPTTPFGDAALTASVQQAEATQAATGQLLFSDVEHGANLDTTLASRTASELAQHGTATPSLATAGSGSGFDWGDAGVGALAAVGLAGIAATAIMQIRGRGRGPELGLSGS
jgi:hypothetical protein